MKKSKEDFSLPYTTSSGISFKTLIFLISLCVLTEIIFFIWHPEEFSMTSVTIFILLLIAILLFYFLGFSSQITTTKDKIIYKSFLVKSEQIFLSDIKKVNLKYKLGGSAEKFTLELYDQKEFSNSPLSINIKHFTRKDLKVLFKVIIRENPSVKMNTLAQRLTEGNFRGVSRRLGRLTINSSIAEK